MEILCAVREPAMREAICSFLTRHQCSIDAMEQGGDILEYALAGRYDGMILDTEVLGKKSLTVLSALRQQGCRAPILMLTDAQDVQARIEALDAGADDCVSKPYILGEIIARVRAMLRRCDQYSPDILTFGHVELGCGGHTLSCRGRSELLSRLEYRLMELFLRYPRMNFSAEVLLERVWDADSDAGVNTVWVYISYLRKKLDRLQADVEIRLRRGIGYSLEMKEE